MQLNGKPGDERGFVHKRIGGAIGGFIGGGPAGAIGGFFGGGGNGRRGPPPLPTGMGGLSQNDFLRFNIGKLSWEALARIMGIGVQQVQDLARVLGLTDPLSAAGNGCQQTTPCLPGTFWDPVTCFCHAPGSPAGGIGEAVLGRYGAALEPSFQTINKMVCLPGMVLGKPEANGLSFCYNKGAISNKERLWPKGRAPLLTGGEMAAIAKASSAVKKFQRTGARFRTLGLLKTPAPRKAKAVPAARTVKVLESGPGSVQL